MDTREQLLERKERLGRRASYSKLSERVGKSHTAIQKALLNIPTDIPMDRANILADVARALDEIEAEDDSVRLAA